MDNKTMLTTIDNPYSPFTNFKDWFTFDVLHGYNSCGYLARIARTSEQFTDEENDSEVNHAIDEIIKHDLQNIYIKVRINDFDKNGIIIKQNNK